MSGVIERIAKLHAKAESARSVGQDAEASAFEEGARAGWALNLRAFELTERAG